MLGLRRYEWSKGGLNSKVKIFHEKRNSLKQERVVQKSVGKNRVRFCIEKSCQLFYQDTGSNRDPVWRFQISRKIQDRVKGGEGEA